MKRRIRALRYPDLRLQEIEIEREQARKVEAYATGSLVQVSTPEANGISVGDLVEINGAQYRVISKDDSNTITIDPSTPFDGAIDMKVCDES